MDENSNSQESLSNEQRVPIPPAPEMPPTPEPVQPINAQPENPQGFAAPVQPTPQAQEQYYQNPTMESFGSDTQDSFNGYVDGLKAIISAPKRLVNGLSQNITKALIFVGISLGALSLVQVLVAVLSTMKANSAVSDVSDSWGLASESTKIEMNGEFWGNLFKSVGLQALYAVGFIFLIAAVVYVLCLIGQKRADFAKSFGLTSVLSINFIAGAIAGVLGLVSLYVTDLGTFIGLAISAVLGIAFIYSSVLLIQGVVEDIGLSYFVTVSAYVVTVVFGLYILGTMIKDYSTYFTVSFGNFGRNDMTSAVSDMSKALKSLEDFDFSDYLN